MFQFSVIIPNVYKIIWKYSSDWPEEITSYLFYNNNVINKWFFSIKPHIKNLLEREFKILTYSSIMKHFKDSSFTNSNFVQASSLQSVTMLPYIYVKNNTYIQNTVVIYVPNHCSKQIGLNCADITFNLVFPNKGDSVLNKHTLTKCVIKIFTIKTIIHLYFK